MEICTSNIDIYSFSEICERIIEQFMDPFLYLLFVYSRT